MVSNASELFQRAVMIEDKDPVQALTLYEKCLALEPSHSAAHINAGTIRYQRQEYTAAEMHYRTALAFDSNSALCHFNLGNVLDHTDRTLEAIERYEAAIELAASYADAHYNLALAYERTSQPRKALSHWIAYTKLDLNSLWSEHAHKRIAVLREQVPVTLMIVSSNNATSNRTKRRAKLFIVSA
jgi:tetratricopeptide (TPR) repeat protein